MTASTPRCWIDTFQRSVSNRRMNCSTPTQSSRGNSLDEDSEIRMLQITEPT